ncbi:unnamed protein product [Effrenium voratum]|uniref:Uncharacterized protein n=1 Tax=Effrenium voratum TaxID=2562239 RepID=A0AA36IYL5_9DINO|nr:unnamed protein product [Effrenium voratum]
MSRPFELDSAAPVTTPGLEERVPGGHTEPRRGPAGNAGSRPSCPSCPSRAGAGAGAARGRQSRQRSVKGTESEAADWRAARETPRESRLPRPPASRPRLQEEPSRPLETTQEREPLRRPDGQHSARRIPATPSSSSLATSTRRTPRQPASRPTSPRYRMNDVLYSQFSPTRHPEEAAWAQRSPMRSALASRGPVELPVPKWQGGLGASGRSKSPPGSRLPGWTRGTCRSLSPPGSPSSACRPTLLASNDCLRRLRWRQSDEHAEDQITKILSYEQKLTRQWTASEFRVIREELRSPIYRDAAKPGPSVACVGPFHFGTEGEIPTKAGREVKQGVISRIAGTLYSQLSPAPQWRQAATDATLP